MDTAKIKKILIIQPSRIGDVIFTLPALASLRKLFPAARIAWLVDDRCAGLLEGNTLLDRVIVFPYVGLKKQLKKFSFSSTAAEIKKLRRTLKEENFDLTIDFHGLAKSAFVALLAGARNRLGSSSSYGMKELSWLVSREIKPRRQEMHCLERHLEVVRHLGGEPVMDFAFPRSQGDAAAVRGLLEKQGVNADKYAVVFPGGGWRSRRWFPERFAEVSDALVRDLGLGVVFIGGQPGGSPEQGIISDIISRMKEKAADLSGQLSLGRLTELIAGAKIFVGNEAGPMHIACGLGVPVVAVIGPTDPARTGPFGKNSIIVRKPAPCAPCRERNCAKMDCMKAVTVEDVLAAVRKLL